MKHKIYNLVTLTCIGILVLMSFTKTSLAYSVEMGDISPGLKGKKDFGHSYHSDSRAKNIDISNSPDDYSANRFYLPLVMHSTKPTISEPNWAMAAANPKRTSWTPEEIRGKLHPLWYRPIEPYILPRVQVIAAYDTLYIATSRGLYAFDANTGSEKWVYPTELPLGHSPTIDNGVAYVGGFDRRIHAIDAFSGQRLWTFEAGAGFDTNPLVLNGKAYVGNRDGNFYAIYAGGWNAGELAWKYQTQGPIHYSAAYDDGVIYFGSDDSHAYALNAQTGGLVWRSAKLPGVGFHSWWPVVYQNWVIFAGSEGYRSTNNPGPGPLLKLTRDDLFPNRAEDPKGTLVGPLGEEPGDWTTGTPTIDTSRSEGTTNGSTTPITEYLEEKPWRRTYFVLDRGTGGEYTTDFDNDGQPEFAPIAWFGARAGNRYPPIVGNDKVLYQTNTYMSELYIPGGHISGWQLGTPFISVVSSDWGAIDEPHAYSAGGDIIYWKLCCDRTIGAIDISVPNTLFADRYRSGYRPATGGVGRGREWVYVNYNLPDLIPDYNIMTYVWDPYEDVPGGVYGGRNGSYGWHGDESPPVPYQGKVYTIQSNALIAFSSDTAPPVALTLAQTVEIQDPDIPSINTELLKERLANEVEKIVKAGHLRPGWVSAGLFDNPGTRCVDWGVDYWHNPADIIYTLMLALPHLPTELQQPARDYLQSEFESYPPYQYFHIGWRDGTPREIFDLPPEVTDDFVNSTPRNWPSAFEGWDFAPHSFYAMWKYAQEFGGARDIFDASKSRLEAPPSDSILQDMPQVHNAFIAGYIGYLELENLAGYPESTPIRNELNRLLTLRESTFSKDAPDIYFQEPRKYYCRATNVSRNFMYLVPELGQYLHDNAYVKVQQALDEYENIAPYWFVSKAEVVFGEGVTAPLFDYPALFQAKAWILNENQEELVKYLDVPAVKVGDLFYIQNLIAAIESENN